MAANNTKPIENAQKAPNYDPYLVVMSGKIPSDFSPHCDLDALRRLAERVAPGALNRATKEGAIFLHQYDARQWDRVFANFKPGPNGTYTFLGQVMDFGDPMFSAKLLHLVKQFRDAHNRRAQQTLTPGSASDSAAGPQPPQRTASAQAVQKVHATTTAAPRPSPQNTISLSGHPTPSNDSPATQASQKTINHPRDDEIHEERPTKRARHQAPNAVAAPSPNPRRPQSHSATKPRTPPKHPRRTTPIQPPFHANPNNNVVMMHAHAGLTAYPSPPQGGLPPRGPFSHASYPDHVFFDHAPYDGQNREWIPWSALPPARPQIPHPTQVGGPSAQHPAVMNKLAAMHAIGPRAELPTPPLTVSPAESCTAQPLPPTASDQTNSNTAQAPTSPPHLISCRWGFCTHTFSADQKPATIGEHLKTVHGSQPEVVPPDARPSRGRQAADAKRYICHWILKDGSKCRKPLGNDGPDVGPIARHVRGQHLEKDT